MNLMCPARILLLPGDVLEPAVGERIAQVYAGTFEVAAGTRLADQLGVRLTVVPELVERPDEELQAIADLHRGETVIVLGLDLGLRLPALVEHTGDGWTRVPTDNELTLAAYEQAADKFRDSLSHGSSESADWWLDAIGEALQPGASVLEIGSGTGEDAVALEERGYRVRRTDAAVSFVEMMRAEGFAADHLNAITDELGGPYDLVFADAVFLHFDHAELTTVLRKAHRAATNLAFTTREGEGGEWSNRFLDLPRRFNSWQEQPLRDLLTETGWTVIHFDRGRTRFGNTWFHVLAKHS
ncbi:class I SAM-dependent methyltransferase [Kribbella qitaiheensis]|uniref:Class I SAM-dependent methyltransferase n=1 Tax=Kribbella qitaiheensis TaxID=1544730 RepID=A0A7G6WUU6_9ACTN|nr:class I SAM-dependent methyltransferase [Kribbella qitaiheensis]QNE17761.1 class I SAM-dependent methyltransferase [Kribbella qitaiheensis]